MDGEGILWTKVNITVDDGIQFLLLERVDTSVSPISSTLLLRQLITAWLCLSMASIPLICPVMTYKSGNCNETNRGKIDIGKRLSKPVRTHQLANCNV